MMERRLSVLKICIRIHFESFRLLLFFFKSHAILRHICAQLFGEFFLRNALCRFFFFFADNHRGEKNWDKKRARFEGKIFSTWKIKRGIVA